MKEAHLSEDHDTLVKYFLGELGPDVAEKVEERLFADDAYTDIAEEVELALTDAYVAETLSPEQREHFETRFMITPERRKAVETAWLVRAYYTQVAQSEKHPVAAPLTATKKRWWQRFPPMQVLAAAIVIALLGSVLAWVALHRTPSQAPERAKAPPTISVPEQPKEITPAPQEAHAPLSPVTPPPKIQEPTAQRRFSAKGLQTVPRIPRREGAPLPPPPEIAQTPPSGVPEIPIGEPKLPPSPEPRVAIAQMDDSGVKTQNENIGGQTAIQLEKSFRNAGIYAANAGGGRYSVAVQIAMIKTFSSGKAIEKLKIPAIGKTQIVLHFKLIDVMTGAVVREGDVLGESPRFQSEDGGDTGKLPKVLGDNIKTTGSTKNMPENTLSLKVAMNDACEKLTGILKAQIQPR